MYRCKARGLWIISRERSWSMTERNVELNSIYKTLHEEGRGGVGEYRRVI